MTKETNSALAAVEKKYKRCCGASVGTNVQPIFSAQQPVMGPIKVDVPGLSGRRQAMILPAPLRRTILSTKRRRARNATAWGNAPGEKRIMN
jgi:hypothetical protein